MPATPQRTRFSNSSPTRLLCSAVVVLLGTMLASSCLQTWLLSRNLATNFVSPAAWRQLVRLPAGAIPSVDQGDVSFGSIALVLSAVSLLTWLVGAYCIARRRGSSYGESLATWGLFGWGWWCLIDVWEWTWIGAGLLGASSLSELLAVSPQLWLTGCLAGWLTTLLTLARGRSSRDAVAKDTLRDESQAARTQRWLWLACGVYVVVFTTMNWRLYFNLLMPHGDSVMYEEHLWNVLHGKGFRSYLDQGLFFGEHIQFVHLFLLPLYVLWPSHLLLELSESTALALGAFPVFWMTRRCLGRAAEGFMPGDPIVGTGLKTPTRSVSEGVGVSGVESSSLKLRVGVAAAARDSRRLLQADTLALAAAVAYLLYAPMQFLDIEIDLKTFRPEAFGIPLLLLTLDQLERRQLIGTLLGLAFTLTVKEDYAILFGPLGVWIAWSRPAGNEDRATGVKPALIASLLPANRDRFLAGMALSVFSVTYLWLATRVVMPWFRSGAEVHYMRYFAKFGESPEQIVGTMLSNPGLLFGELCSTATVLYALLLLAPLAFIPLLSLGRLAVGLPLFGILCLNELAKDPRHQFHAPLVAVIFWALAGGLPRAIALVRSLLACGTAASATNDEHNSTSRTICTHLIWTASLCTGLFLTISPLGCPFWDAGSNWHWQTLYGPSRRGELFARILPLIPRDSRVASTDFVHPRFTHHERSYDYSGYRRKVAGDRIGVPDDTDFLVIDTNHRYSEIKSPAEVPEYRDHPADWELLPAETDGYYIVLKRRR